MGFVEQLCKAKAARRTTWGLRRGSSGGCDPRSHGPGDGPPESAHHVSAECGAPGNRAGRRALRLRLCQARLPGSRARPTRSGAFKSKPADSEWDSRARPTRSASGAAVTESPSRSRPTRSEAVEPWAGALPTRSGVEPTEGLGFRV